MRLLGNGQGTPDHMILPVLARHVDGDSWAHRLHFSVVSWAVKDALGNPYMLKPDDKLEAVKYLCGQMPHAQAIGISPEFVRSLIRDCGVDLEAVMAEAEIQAESYKAEKLEKLRAFRERYIGEAYR